jgi:hypothetical protein
MALLALCRAVAAVPEFIGVLTSGGEAKFALVDPEARDAPRWVRTGEEFDGCTVLAYHATAEDLEVRIRGETVALHLKTGKTVALRLTPEAVRAIAERQISSCEHWGPDVRWEEPHLFKGNWLLVARHDGDGRTETRILVITPAGSIRNYIASVR